MQYIKLGHIGSVNKCGVLMLVSLRFVKSEKTEYIGRTELNL